MGAVPAALDVAGVSHSYGKRKALSDVSFAVTQASFCVLLGLDGAGKSTLFCLVTRLYAAQKGRIRDFRLRCEQHPQRGAAQAWCRFPSADARSRSDGPAKSLYHAALHGISAREAKQRAGSVLDQVAMAGRANDKVRTLSGGQMRRVEIARALLHRPRMLLLDEPTVGLDIKARADILKHVRGLVAEAGIGVLWATHLIDEIEPGDDVVVLHEGRVLDRGKASEVAARANAPDIGAAFNRLTGTAGKGASCDQP